jgi:hypothetical protein
MSCLKNSHVVMPDAFLIIPSTTRNDPPGVRSSDLVPCFKSDISTQITLIPLHADFNVGTCVCSPTLFISDPQSCGHSTILHQHTLWALCICHGPAEPQNPLINLPILNRRTHICTARSTIQHGRKEPCLLFIRESRNTTPSQGHAHRNHSAEFPPWPCACLDTTTRTHARRPNLFRLNSNASSAPKPSTALPPARR